MAVTVRIAATRSQPAATSTPSGLQGRGAGAGARLGAFQAAKHRGYSPSWMQQRTTDQLWSTIGLTLENLKSEGTGGSGTARRGSFAERRNAHSRNGARDTFLDLFRAGRSRG